MILRDVSDGPFFSVLPEKNGKKRGAGYGLVRAAGTVQVSPYVQSLRTHVVTLRAIWYAPPVMVHQD